MKCLNRIEIQEFLDKEIKPSLIARISDHIEKCEKCSSLYREAVEDNGMINKLLGDSPQDKISVPPFNRSVFGKKGNRFFSIVPILTATAVIVFIVLFRSHREPVSEKIPEAELLMYEFLDGQDLNKLWHDKTQLLIIQDEKGNVIQSIITN